MNRLAVVAAARAWLGTPFQHQARVKGVGVDCIGLVIGVARELGLVSPDFDIDAYPRVPDGKTLLPIAKMHMTEVDRSAMQAGDVVAVALGSLPQHFGVLGDYRHGGFSIIHAASQSGAVIETRLMFSRAMKFVAAFALPGVA